MTAAQRSAFVRLHALILTHNEELHIARCLDSLAGVASAVTVVDSGSTDGTVSIAKRHGADVISRPWVNYAQQMNIAIDHAQTRFAQAGGDGWLMRIDADEVLTPASGEDLSALLAALPDTVAGVALRRRIHFMGRRIRWGGVEPSWQLRIFRVGRGHCEARWMDEHIVVDGDVVKARSAISDVNLKPLGWWIEKHNTYASREAIDLLHLRRPPPTAGDGQRHATSPGASLKRAIKTRLYARLPQGWRAALYFLFRYVLLLGVLDGRQGFYFHVLQAFWYRTLVDAKMLEITRRANATDGDLDAAILAVTGINAQSVHPSPPAQTPRRLPASQGA